jgi:hypothetical protein
MAGQYRATIASHVGDSIGWVALSMEPWNVCHWQRIRRERRFNHVEASSNSQPVLKCGTVIHSTGVRMQVARRARRVRLEGSCPKIAVGWFRLGKFDIMQTVTFPQFACRPFPNGFDTRTSARAASSTLCFLASHHRSVELLPVAHKYISAHATQPTRYVEVAVGSETRKGRSASVHPPT